MNENRIISWPTFILSSLMIIIMGTIVIFIIGPRLVSSRELPRPTLQPTAHLSLFQPTNTSTPLPTATATPTSTATPTLTPSPTNTPIPPTAVPSQTLPPGVTPSPTLPPTPEPPTLRLVAGQPQSYLTQFRLVTYYGVPTGPQLGILGAAPRPTMLQQLQGLAAQYQALSLDHHVLPTYHIIVTIADPFPGDFNNYSHWLNNDVLKEWVNSAAESGVAVILDIQPGHAGISFEINRLREFLLLPHVHLALDPIKRSGK